ncbi:transposon Tf2-6 polyprotein [Nephila pilipes]|uniref:Transposon Tf2-6 polyprotein n=1 Tax=Nephila pilipes TaxID=299642 RepID=A0A8X6PL97_NEPPI|nr:transposon Tf2-6 polyprotein [Nephila pilipes]
MKSSSGLKDMSVNTVRNQLEYIDLLIDGKKVKCLKDSGSELIILNKALFPGKSSTGSIQIKSCFGNIVEAETSSFNFSLDENQNIELCGGLSSVSRDAIPHA